MPARTLPHHKENPYRKPANEQTMVVFTPSGYTLNVLLTALSPAALRCWLFLLARLETDGSAMAPLTDLREHISAPAPTLSRALGELAQFNLISKRGNGRYWINPSLARALVVNS